MLLLEDHRLGGEIRYLLTENPRALMQIPPEILKCVAFLAYFNGAEYEFIGTAFLVLRKSAINHVYLVTAKHSIENASFNGRSDIFLRFNEKNGGARWVKTEVPNWHTHPSDESADVAIHECPWDPQYDHLAYDVDSIRSRAQMKSMVLDVGTDVFVTGLFHPHHGRTRNIPIVRVGNIAAMPEEKVNTQRYGDIDAYLIEARSVGGLSGSPVFAYVDQSQTVLKGRGVLRGGGFSLMGLVHGHFDVPPTKLDDIAIVVTGDKILEVLNQPEILEKEKEKEEDARRKNNYAVED